MPSGEDLKVTVKLPTGSVYIQVWKLEVGRITLFLMDTNIPENELPQDRDITDSLYGGDNDTRIRQEIVLGIGGMRALKAMGLEPTVFHMNEGHSAFLSLEQVRIYMRDAKLTFEEALEGARTSNVFTTHTPVPAGIDLFDPGMMYHYFSEYCSEVGIDFQQLMSLGRRNPNDRDERFSMAVLALNTSSYRNAVSRLHRQVSQEMFHDMWPQLPVWEVPITSVTNGVHVPSWINGDLAGLYDQYLQPGLAGAIQRTHHLGARERDPGRGTAGSSPQTQAPAGHLRARRASTRPPCAGRPLPGRCGASERGARPERVHHRVRAPFRHL